jgi:H+/Cl- antiporter ClcA
VDDTPHRFTLLKFFTRWPGSEQQIQLVLTLVIGAVVGLVVVAFIVLTENLGSKLYPAGGAAWRRVFIPLAGSLITGFLLARYFPNARGSGIPQTKTALFIRDGYIAFRTVVGKFGLSSISLARASRWGARVHRCRWAPELLRCSAGGSGSVPLALKRWYPWALRQR